MIWRGCGRLTSNVCRHCRSDWADGGSAPAVVLTPLTLRQAQGLAAGLVEREPKIGFSLLTELAKVRRLPIRGSAKADPKSGRDGF